jgi:hypothetical protein
MRKFLFLLLLAISACSKPQPSSPTSDAPASTPDPAPTTPEISPTATQSPVTPGVGSVATPSISPTAPAVSNQKAVLTAKDPGSQINVREQDSTTSQARHSAQAGDSVLVLSKTQGDDGQVWYQVKLAQSGAVGWIRGDFVSLASNGATEPSPTPTVEATSSP